MKYKVGDIRHLKTFGMMSVYKRLWTEPGLRRFTVVNHYTGCIQEEFSRQSSAERWAKENRSG